MEAYTPEDLGWARHSSPRLYPPSSIPWQGPDDVATKRLVGVFGNTGCIGPPYKVFGRLGYCREYGNRTDKYLSVKVATFRRFLAWSHTES